MECLEKQAIRTARGIGFSKIDAIIQASKGILENYQEEVLGFFAKEYGMVLQKDIEIPPTLLAVPLYNRISQITGNLAPYKEIKKQSMQKAREIKQKLSQKIQNYSQEKRLEFALKCAVFGNVIDYGAEYEFDLEAEYQKISAMDFGYYHFEAFLESLKSTKTLLYIGDNAGENEFDEILIESLKESYPQMQIIYFVRGGEIINDVTMKDLRESDSRLFELCGVQDSGVPSPGFIYPLANAKAKEIFNKADLVLAKGMGNFESMEKTAKEDSRIFFLFKIKCNVVADYLKKELGKFVLLSLNHLKGKNNAK